MHYILTISPRLQTVEPISHYYYTKTASKTNWARQNNNSSYDYTTRPEANKYINKSDNTIPKSKRMVYPPTSKQTKKKKKKNTRTIIIFPFFVDMKKILHRADNIHVQHTWCAYTSDIDTQKPHILVHIRQKTIITIIINK